jgi:hypothetical protein
MVRVRVYKLLPHVRVPPNIHSNSSRFAPYIQVIKNLLSVQPLFPCLEELNLFPVVHPPLLCSDRVALYKLNYFFLL